MERITITEWLQQQMLDDVRQAGCCVDATAGNGKDTLFLCRNMRPGGRLLAFDIQSEALEATASLLGQYGYGCLRRNAGQGICLLLDGHENMEYYLEAETVDVMVFNLGYLPGGDREIATRPDTTLRAIQAGLSLLKPGGLMGICIYSGGDSGFAEHDAVLGFLKSLDCQAYTVMVNQFYNKPHHPPLPVLVRKEK